MISGFPSSATICTTNIERAKKFYGGTLGLERIEEHDVLFFQLQGGSTLLIYPRGKAPRADHTTLTWWVEGLDGIVKNLASKGVKFERYPGFNHDALGIAQLGDDGPRAAWFDDPDGNIISLTELPQ